MPLILLHGLGLSAINFKISSLKRGFETTSITELNVKTTNWLDARTEVLTPSLFSEKRLVVLEDYIDIPLESLHVDDNLTLVLKFSRPLLVSSLILKAAAKLNAQIFKFDEASDQSVFPFLDYLAEQNPRALVELEKLMPEYGSQYLLTMIFYMLRRMVIPAKNLPPFVKKKLDQQKRNFPEEKIKRFYKIALETDFKIKSGRMDERVGLHLLTEQFLLKAKTRLTF